MPGRIIAIVVVILMVGVGSHAGGTATVQSFVSEALGTSRSALVYLPEGYLTSGLDYPVIYFLHGAGGGVGTWYLSSFIPALDEMIAESHINPMIIVEPDANEMTPPFEWRQQQFTQPIFHFHVNSPLLGRNEDYLAEDLVEWVDSNFRTVAEREGRLIIGRSMGGHGAMRLALRHSDVFAGASIDAGFMAVTEGYIDYQLTPIRALTPGPPHVFSPLTSHQAAQLFAICAAFTPNMDNPPWYVDFYLDENGEVDQDVRRRLLAQSPPALVEEFAGSELSLDLFLRIGDGDGWASTFWPVIDALENHKVAHLVRVFEGTHDTPPLEEKLAVHLTYFMPIKATAEISPRFVDPRLYPQQLRLAVELPGDLDVADIDCSTLALIGIDGNRLGCPLGCAAACEISDINGNGHDDLSVWLPSNRMARSAAAMGAKAGDTVELTIRGELDDGRFFQATDTVTLGSTLNVAYVD